MRKHTHHLLLALTLLLAACDTDNPSGNNNPPPHETPAIINVSRTSLLPGDTLTITGQEFGSSRGEVWFGSYLVPAANIASWGDSRIELVVPLDGLSGLLEVQPVGGEAIVSDVAIYVIGHFYRLPLRGLVKSGVTLADPFVVRLVDTSGRGVPGEAVWFSSDDPGAIFGSGRAVTDANGYAQSYLTPGSYLGGGQVLAQAYCDSPSVDCSLRVEVLYEDLALRYDADGAVFDLHHGGDFLTGWLAVEEIAGRSFGVALTSNYQPEAPSSPKAVRSSSVSPPVARVGAPEVREVLIAYRDDIIMSQSTKASVRTSLGLASVGTTLAGGVEVARVPHGADLDEVVARLNADPRVRVAEPNHYVSLAPLPRDRDLYQQWGHFVVGAPVAWRNEPVGSDAVVVAIVDSGVDLGHVEFEGRLLPGYDFCGDDTENCRNWDPDPHAYDWWNNVHGTHVAGVVGAAINNGEPVTGVAPNVQLLPVKVFPDDDSGSATISATINGILWAAGLPVPGAPTNAHPADVINLSLGGDFESVLMKEAIDRARERGVVIVAATGNDSAAGQVPVSFPAAAEGVIGVGAMKLGGDSGRPVWDATAAAPEFVRAEFSNYGKGPNGPGVVDIVAPGWNILSTLPWDDWGSMSGTSMATPYVSGAAALLIAQDRTRTPDDIEWILKQSAYYDPTIMNVEEFGAGILRVDGALGLPAPTSPVDRNATIRVRTGEATASGALDLMTGQSGVVDLGVLAPGDSLRVELEHDGKTYADSLTP